MPHNIKHNSIVEFFFSYHSYNFVIKHSKQVNVIIFTNTPSTSQLHIFLHQNKYKQNKCIYIWSSGLQQYEYSLIQFDNL